MPNHDTTLTLKLIRLLEQYPEGLGATACWEALRCPQALSTVRSALSGMRSRNIVVRHGRWGSYTYALQPHFRQAFAGREETQP
jgi:DNA-binding IclR family transcriptional regulator